MQTSALILGILALSFLFLPGLNLVLSPMMGVSALIIGLMSSLSAKKGGNDSHRGTAGAVTGAVALLLSLCLIGGCWYMVDGFVTEQRANKAVTDQVDQRFDDLSEDLRDELREEIRIEVQEEMKKAREKRAERWIREHPDLPPDEALKNHFEERMDEWVDWLEMMPVQPDPGVGGLKEMDSPKPVKPDLESPFESPADPPAEKTATPAPKPKPKPKPKKMDPTYPQ